MGRFMVPLDRTWPSLAILVLWGHTTRDGAAGDRDPKRQRMEVVMEVLLVGRTEAAQALRIPMRALDRLLMEGTIPSRKIGRRRPISRQALEDFANQGCPPKQEITKADTSPR